MKDNKTIQTTGSQHMTKDGMQKLISAHETDIAFWKKTAQQSVELMGDKDAKIKELEKKLEKNQIANLVKGQQDTNTRLKWINDSMDNIAESLSQIAYQQKFQNEKNEYTSTEDLGYISVSLEKLVKHFTKQ